MADDIPPLRMSRTHKYLATIMVITAIAAGLLGFTKPGHQLLHTVGFAFLGFTKPGHQVLYKLGFTAACDSSDGCSN